MKGEKDEDKEEEKEEEEEDEVEEMMEGGEGERAARWAGKGVALSLSPQAWPAQDLCVIGPKEGGALSLYSR